MPQITPPQHVLGHEGMLEMKLEKASSAVDYRVVEPGANSCGGCRFYDAICMACSLVEGSIDPAWGCNLWAAPLSSQGPAPAYPADVMAADWSEHGGQFQIFVEASDLNGEWIPYMPKPGKYQSPRYGEINITPEMNQALIDSFTQEVYQKHIPLDAEHETKLSGAIAYIRGMRMNGDNSVDISPEWTPRGTTLVSSGQFKYVSPEFFPTWTDPATGTVHKNVVAGGAITTRPFFKDKVLRALVQSSEDGGVLIAPEQASEGDQTVAEQDPTPVTLTEAQVDEKIKQASEAATAAAVSQFTEKIGELQEQVKAAETLAAAEKTAREAASTRLAEMEKSARELRFKDLIAGRGGEGDGAAWPGDSSKNLSTLVAMAEALGEDSEAFKDHVENQRAIAAQSAEAALFSAVGSTASLPSTNEPSARLEALVDRKFAEAKTKGEAKTRPQVYDEVLSTPEGGKLYEAAEAAARR